jgi:hypothetical protein
MLRKYKNYYTGFAIAIAWPETFCKQPGYWYDGITNILGFSTNHYYKVGHAALVLVDSETKKCHYFDFGRYHTPFQHGRVRSEITDHNLVVKTLAQISDNDELILNYKQILTELQLNPECHGEGALYASYSKIHFNRAYNKVLQLQQQSPISYGPFRFKGSNCSRFVNTAILAGQPPLKYSFRLNYLVPFTPTPINNVNSLKNKIILPKLQNNIPFCPAPVSDKNKLKNTLPQPPKNSNIPENAKWLSGEGAGSWFSISVQSGTYQISRFNPDGELECKSDFTISEKHNFNINNHFVIDHLSHCQKVVVIQNDAKIEFIRT